MSVVDQVGEEQVYTRSMDCTQHIRMTNKQQDSPMLSSCNYRVNRSNILENEELLSISHSSRAEDYTLSINLVRNALQPMLETQRSIHDEQGQTHSSTSGTTKEFSPEPTVQESLGKCVKNTSHSNTRLNDTV